MSERSHIDRTKLSKVPSGHPFEYRDVVSESLPMDEHTDDGRWFKAEVDRGVYSDVIVDHDTGEHILYRKK